MLSRVLSCVVSCMPQMKPTPLLLASVTSERWIRGTHMRSRSCMKTPCFQGLYASKHLQKNRTTSYDFETNNRRSGPKGRGFESRHFDTFETLANAGVFLFAYRTALVDGGSFLLKNGFCHKRVTECLFEQLEKPVKSRGCGFYLCHRGGTKHGIYRSSCGFDAFDVCLNVEALYFLLTDCCPKE